MLLLENAIKPPMKTHLKALFVLITFVTSIVTAQEQEILMEKQLALVSPDMASVLDKTESDIKAFAENFIVRLDKKSKIVSEQVVSGSLLEPVLNVSIEKCVFIFCQTIDLDAVFKLYLTDGQAGANCDQNYLLVVDFQRSSSMLSELYTSMNTKICFMKTANGASAKLQIALVHAETYSSGIVQKNAFNLISLQPEAILQSFITVMKLNGVSSIQVVE